MDYGLFLNSIHPQPGHHAAYLTIGLFLIAVAILIWSALRNVLAALSFSPVRAARDTRRTSSGVARFVQNEPFW
jgi:hypothetical protein